MCIWAMYLKIIYNLWIILCILIQHASFKLAFNLTDRSQSKKKKLTEKKNALQFHLQQQIKWKSWLNTIYTFMIGLHKVSCPNTSAEQWRLIIIIIYNFMKLNLVLINRLSYKYVLTSNKNVLWVLNYYLFWFFFANLLSSP